MPQERVGTQPDIVGGFLVRILKSGQVGRPFGCQSAKAQTAELPELELPS